MWKAYGCSQPYLGGPLNISIPKTSLSPVVRWPRPSTHSISTACPSCRRWHSTSPVLFLLFSLPLPRPSSGAGWCLIHVWFRGSNHVSFALTKYVGAVPQYAVASWLICQQLAKSILAFDISHSSVCPSTNGTKILLSGWACGRLLLMLTWWASSSPYSRTGWEAWHTLSSL